jgi:hypothetical protein
MWLRLRQICLVAADIEKLVGELGSVFGLEVCFVDSHVAKYGLENRLLPIGNQLLEIVAPTTSGTAAGRYLDRRKGDGGYMVITQCDDHEPRKRRVAELGIRVANAIERPPFHGMQLHPRDTGGSFFEIDFQEGGEASDGPWAPAGDDWQTFRRTEIIDAITAAEIQSPDPLTLAERWGGIAELAVERITDGDGRPAYSIELDNAEVRFVAERDDRGEGLCALDLRVVDEPRALDNARRAGVLTTDGAVQIGGVRLNLVTDPITGSSG